jgi:hypothetical protein
VTDELGLHALILRQKKSIWGLLVTEAPTFLVRASSTSSLWKRSVVVQSMFLLHVTMPGRRVGT